MLKLKKVLTPIKDEIGNVKKDEKGKVKNYHNFYLYDTEYPNKKVQIKLAFPQNSQDFTLISLFADKE